MIDLYLPLKFAHVLGATVLFGTGAGIAFFMMMAHRSRNADFIARTAQIVVLADMIFTASAVVLQPITGMALAYRLDLPLTTPWIAMSIGLYLVAGAFWLPVVWMQLRMRDLAREAATRDTPLPALYHRLFKIWFAFGFPAFFAVMGVVWLMIAKPT